MISYKDMIKSIEVAEIGREGRIVGVKSKVMKAKDFR